VKTLSDIEREGVKENTAYLKLILTMFHNLYYNIIIYIGGGT